MFVKNERKDVPTSTQNSSNVFTCKARQEQRGFICHNQVIVKVNDVVRSRQNPQHMVCHAVAGRLNLNCPSNVSRAVGVQLPQDLPPV